jgi:hypothetical protein
MRSRRIVLDVADNHGDRHGTQTFAEQYPAGPELRTTRDSAGDGHRGARTRRDSWRSGVVSTLSPFWTHRRLAKSGYAAAPGAGQWLRRSLPVTYPVPACTAFSQSMFVDWCSGSAEPTLTARLRGLRVTRLGGSVLKMQLRWSAIDFTKTLVGAKWVVR